MPPKQTPVRPVPVHLKEAFKQELDKMLQGVYIKPVHEATPWIKSYVIVEGKDKLGRLKIRICLDPTNLNVAVIHEPWFSKTPDDIAHMLLDGVIITATDCTKGIGMRPWMKNPPTLQHLALSLEDFASLLCHLVLVWLGMYFSESLTQSLAIYPKLPALQMTL